jgi:protein phosphatase
MPAELIIQFHQISDVGLVRSENQDSFGKFPEESSDLNGPDGLLFIVADGMGGHRGGQQASQMAVQTIAKSYFSNPSAEIATRLREAFDEANLKIFQFAQEHPEFQGMGTTCTALALKNDKGYIAHVGDSRAYRITHSEIKQLTSDHSQVAEMQRQGILTEKEARDHPQRNLLNRALGVKPTIEVDLINDITIAQDDHYLLCSDGLGKVDPQKLKQTVLSNMPEKACQKLVKLANEKGGEDNVTVQVIRVAAPSAMRNLFSSKLGGLWRK